MPLPHVKVANFSTSGPSLMHVSDGTNDIISQNDLGLVSNMPFKLQILFQDRTLIWHLNRSASGTSCDP